MFVTWTMVVSSVPMVCRMTSMLCPMWRTHSSISRASTADMAKAQSAQRQQSLEDKHRSGKGNGEMARCGAPSCGGTGSASRIEFFW